LRISIGILAWNEAEGIAGTIESLWRQTLLSRFHDRVHSVEIVCVPNGCRDSTASVAAAALAAGAEKCPLPYVSWRVREVAEAGKSNAWNRFVHDFCDQAADYVILIDADIRFDSEHALQRLVERLDAAPDAVAATGRPIKHLAFKREKTLFDRASLLVSSLNESKAVRLAGCLYCVRGTTIREMWLPTGLLVEDSVVKSMLLTDLFRKPVDPTRIVMVPDAGAIFEAYGSVMALLRHERRIVVGVAMNAILFDFLWKHAGARGAGHLIRERSVEDPDWFRKLLRRRIGRGSWVVPPEILVRRFALLRRQSIGKKLLKLPVVVGSLFIDVPAMIWAEWSVRRGETSGMW
jgi:glycosyltransferase involved in cell wall biosynthesis